MISNSITSFICMVLFVLLSSCTNSNYLQNENGQYFVKDIDTTFFVKYNSIILQNSKNENIWLLSEKFINEDSIVRYKSKYHKLDEKTTTNLKLIKIDSLKLIKAKIKQNRSNEFLYMMDNELLWKTDTVKHDVWFSPQLKGLYLIK